MKTLSFIPWVIVISGFMWLLVIAPYYFCSSDLRPKYTIVKLIPTKPSSHWQEQDAFAWDIAKLIVEIHAQGYFCTFGEAWRSHEQAEIYAHQGKGIVNSLHCERLAFDLNLYSSKGEYLKERKDYEPFGKYWCSLNKKNRWGGCFHDHTGRPKPDSDHYERNAF